MLNHYERVVVIDSDSQLTDLVHTMSSKTIEQEQKANSATVTPPAPSTSIIKNKMTAKATNTTETIHGNTAGSWPRSRSRSSSIGEPTEESEHSIADPFSLSDDDNDNDVATAAVGDDNDDHDRGTQNNNSAGKKRKYYVQEWFRQQFAIATGETVQQGEASTTTAKTSTANTMDTTARTYHTPIHLSILPLSWRICRKLFPTIGVTVRSLGDIYSSFDYGLCCNWYIYGKKLLQRPIGATTIGNVSRGFFECILYQDLRYKYGIVTNTVYTTTGSNSTNTISGKCRITWINHAKLVGLEQEQEKNVSAPSSINIVISGVRILLPLDTVSRIRNVPIVIHCQEYSNEFNDSSQLTSPHPYCSNAEVSLPTNLVVDCTGYSLVNMCTTNVRAGSNDISSSPLFSIPVPPIDVYNPKIQYSARAYAFEDDKDEKSVVEGTMRRSISDKRNPKQSIYYSKQTARQKIDKLLAGVGGATYSFKDDNNDDCDDVQPDETAIYQTYPFGKASGKHAYLFRSEQNVVIASCFGIGGYKTPTNVISSKMDASVDSQEGSFSRNTRNAKYIEQYLESSIANLTPILEEELTSGSSSRDGGGGDSSKQPHLPHEQIQSMLHDSLSSLILEHGQELDDWSNEILNDKKWKRWLQQLERKEHLRQFELCNDIADRKLFDTIQFDIPACYIVRWERLLPNHVRLTM